MEGSTPATPLLPMRHQCGTAADDPRYYDRPGNAQPEHTRNRAHNGVNAKRPPPTLYIISDLQQIPPYLPARSALLARENSPIDGAAATPHALAEV